MKIGVAVTTKNRRSIALKCVEQWRNFLPDGAKFIVVDDNSDEPFPDADFRFERNAGIAVAKNKCIELLEGCEHVFLSDDDVWPVSHAWWIQYVNSNQKHFCFTFATLSQHRSTVKNIDGEPLVVHNAVRGCMMYYHRDVFEKLGGFNPDFIGYGWEHIEFTNRIHNAGFTAERYLDVMNSETLFYSLDREREVVSSVSKEERLFEMNNRLMIYSKYHSQEYVDYREKELQPVLLTAYFTTREDPQRGVNWSRSNPNIEKLIETAKSHGIKTVVFYDSIDQPDVERLQGELVEFIRIRPFREFCTNVYRRFVFYEYLKYRHHPMVFMVDSTDVEVLKNPFEYIKPEVLYVGNELKSINNPWLRAQFELIKLDFDAFKDEFGTYQLLNAGIIGGYYDIVLEFLAKNTDIHREESVGLQKSTDMAVFNYVVCKYFMDRHEHGEHINTPFKFNKYTDAIFKHK
jgi:glycosyltransferase involved in cell wall biosynthesis